VLVRVSAKYRKATGQKMIKVNEKKTRMDEWTMDDGRWMMDDDVHATGPERVEEGKGKATDHLILLGY